MQDIKRGEIYLADLCPVVGSEQGGKRPVLIIQNDVGNRYSPTTIVAPITSKRKSNMVTHVELNGYGLSRLSVVMSEQIRTIDKSRLIEYIGTLDDNTMKSVNKAISNSFDI